MKPTEDGLCSAFAERMKDSPEFLVWVLDQTKFREHGKRSRLLHEEQMSIRPRKAWWRHWWCHIPELKKDRETDIFAVFEQLDNQRRFALHIENKMSNGRFAEGQAEAYRVRAQHMANKPEYLDYVDFQTVLLSPSQFQKKYSSSCALFDIFVSYEDVSNFIPEFGMAFNKSG